MLRAIRSGRCVDKYGTVKEIIAGQSVWSEESEELQDPAVAALFAPDRSRNTGPRARLIRDSGIATTIKPTATTITADTRGRDDRGEIPELRERVTFPAQGKLSRSAQQAIRDDLWALRNANVESGGFLFARRFSSRDTVIDIPHATGSGEAVQRHSALSLDVGEWERAERSMEADGFPLLASGCWHSHTATRNGKPSLTDLRSWLGMLDYAAEENYRSQPVHVGLIYCPDFHPDGHESWASPVAHAWVVHREGKYSRTPVCDRLAIRGRA